MRMRHVFRPLPTYVLLRFCAENAGRARRTTAAGRRSYRISPRPYVLSAILPFLQYGLISATIGNGVARARLATKVLYDQDISTARAEDVLAALRGNPVLHLCDGSEVIDVPLTKLAATFKLSASNSTL